MTVKKYFYYDKDGNLLGAIKCDDYHAGIKELGIDPELVEDFDTDIWDDEA